MYSVGNYVTGADAVRVLGLADRDQAWIWLQNRASAAANARLGKMPRAYESVRVRLQGLERGVYRLEWFDPWRARVVAKGAAECTRAGMMLTSPRFDRSLAVRCRRR